MTELVICPVCSGSGVVDPDAAQREGWRLSDRDQTASEHDQTASDRDQTASDRDHRSSTTDQEAADESFAAGGSPTVHEHTTQARIRSDRDRDASAQSREESSVTRAETSEERDRRAEERDRVAEERDRDAIRRDRELARDEFSLRAESYRAHEAVNRSDAAAERAAAALDRARASEDRAESARLHAETQKRLELAAIDELTGAWARRDGLANLAREIERARRTDSDLTLAFIDVDSLKWINDTWGHSAGDRLLRLVADTVKAHIRPYDIVVRYGGDEFLCAMPNFTRTGAKQRMDLVSSTLSAANERHSIACGYAERRPDDALEDLISRADNELIAARRPPAA